MASVPSIGGLAVLNPLQNPVLSGINQGAETIQGLMNLRYAPQQIQSEIAKNQAIASMNTARGGYYDQYGNYRGVQAENQAQGYGGNTGQAFLMAQSIMRNPNASQDEKDAAQLLMTRVGAFGMGNVPNTPTGQALVAGGLQKSYENNPTSSPFSAVGTTPAGTYNEFNKQYNATTQEKEGSAAQKVAGAEKAAIDASNAGSPYGSGVSPNVPTGTPPATQTLGTGGAPTQYPTTQNYTSWKPEQQFEYVANNQVAPPLPSGTAITTKIDPKTESRINGLAPTAQAINFMQQGLNSPYVQKYLGKQGPQYVELAKAEISRTGQIPPDYANYLAFAATSQSMIADTIATTQSGSRSFGMMMQFQKLFDPGAQVSLDQARQSLNNAGKILYDEGTAYVGAPYEPGLRNAAFNGVKILQSNGFGGTPPQKTPSGSVDISAAPAQMNEQQFKAWYAKTHGGK